MKTFDLRKYKNCYFRESNYTSNGALALLIENQEDGPICTLSINIEASDFLLKDQFYIKQYDGMDLIGQELTELGLIEDLNSVARQGWGVYKLYRKLPKIKEYIKEE